MTLPTSLTIYDIERALNNPTELNSLSDIVANSNTIKIKPKKKAIDEWLSTFEAEEGVLKARDWLEALATPVVCALFEDIDGLPKSIYLFDEIHNTHTIIQTSKNVYLRHEPANAERTLNYYAFRNKLTFAVDDHLNQLDPERQVAQARKSFESNIIHQRDRIEKEDVALSGDFWTDLNTLAEHCPCFEAFENLLGRVSMLNMGNRHLTRLSRACDAFQEATTTNEQELMVYRAAPIDVEQGIEAGDWVTPSKAYAESHLALMEENEETVCVYECNASPGEIFMQGDDNEFCFVPRQTWGEHESLFSAWSSLDAAAGKPRAYPTLESLWSAHQAKNNTKSLSPS
ncbi:hypothetical protein AB6D11_00725 [Vibrio splendidus]